MSEVANTEKLIELVRERSLLYDLSDIDYKNRDKKGQAWLEVATEMGFGDCKIWIAKWKSLKDSYNKFKKNNETFTGQSYKKYKSWPWASQMRFLDDFNVRRPTESNSQPSQTINHTTISSDTDKSSMDETESTTHSEVLVNEAGPSQQINTRKRIKTKNDFSDSHRIIEYLKNKNEQKSKLDGTDHFFLSYAQTFKALPPRMQCMVKLEMATLFARYELQMAGESDASASRVAPQSFNQKSCSSTPNSMSVPSPADEQSSSSWAVPSPVTEKFNQEQTNRVVYVLPATQTASAPRLSDGITEYYETISYSLANSNDE